MRAFGNELKLKLHRRNQTYKLLQKALHSLRLARNLQKASGYALMWHQDFLKRAFFYGLLRQMDTKAAHEQKVTQMRSVLDSRLKTRVILSLKYYLLCQGSQQVIRQKLDKTLLMKAFGALQYSTVA